jgi:DNA-binding response OmpR family regulator
MWPKLAITSRGARVLIVEDNLRFRKLMSHDLALDGFTVTGNTNSMRLHMRIKARNEYPNEPFDLIVTDIQIPGESGLVSLEWLCHRRCLLPHLW